MTTKGAGTRGARTGGAPFVPSCPGEIDAPARSAGAGLNPYSVSAGRTATSRPSGIFTSGTVSRVKGSHQLAPAGG